MQLDNQIASRDWRLRSANSNHIPGATPISRLHHRYYRNILHNVSQGPQMPNIANEESPYLSR
jgi:hypothetical protein